MIQLLAGTFFILFYGVSTQRSPLDTTAPITRISPALRNNSTAPDSFGFAVALYQLDPTGTNLSSWRIVVGAPNGSYPGGLSLNIPGCQASPANNTGLVYLCSIQPGRDTCDGAVGSGTAPSKLFDCSIPSTAPGPQQMGATLYSSGGYLVACAPGFGTNSQSSPLNRGTCYFSLNNSLQSFTQMLPCQTTHSSAALVYYDDTHCYSGLSLAVKNKIAIFGAPLAFTTGMASYIQMDTPPALFSLAGSTITSGGNTASSGGSVYGSTSMNINGSTVYWTNALKGYSVGIGHITRANVYDYLVSVPRWDINNYVGTVEVFAFLNNGTPSAGSTPIASSTPIAGRSYDAYYNNTYVYDSLMNVTASGTQNGEQFGASIDTADLDQDGYDELIVGAPHYTDYQTFKYEIGRVYVFQNTKGNLSSTPITLMSDTPSIGGRFGHVVLSVGDINSDGTEDFAVGAPYEPCTSPDGTTSTGSVYLYIGGRTTLVTMAQKITACDIRQQSLAALKNAPLRSFGYSLASKADLDGNTYNDLAVGAFESRAVFLLRTFSVANVTSTLTNVGGSVSLTKSGCGTPYACGTIMLCATYNCTNRTASCSNSLLMPFTISESTGKAFFSNGTATAPAVINATMQATVCTNVTFYSMLGQADLSPFQFVATVQDIPRSRVSDSGTTLADFRAIPILKGTSSFVNVNFARACANPNFCMGNLTLSLTSGPVFKDALQNTETNLTVNETASVSFSFTVNNTGDEVAGINMAMSAPSFVTGMQLVKASGGVITCTSIANTTFVCSNIISGYLVPGNSSVVMVTLTLDTTSIPFDPSLLTFNVSSQDNESNLLDNVATVQLQPTASASVSIFSAVFNPQLAYYKTVKSSSDPTTLSAIGYSVTLNLEFQRTGPTAIPSMTLTLSLPLGGSDLNSYYLYPASVATTLPSIGISCIGNLNPSNLKPSKRSLSVDTAELLRTARQAQTQSSAFSLNCSQPGPQCTTVVCTLTNISAATTTFNVITQLYVNDRYFTAKVGSHNMSLTAAATLSISSPAIFVGVVSKSYRTATLNISPPSATPNPIQLYVIIPPIIAAVVILVIAVIILYACGFFRRKKREEEDGVEGIDESNVTKATITPEKPDDSVKL